MTASVWRTVATVLTSSTLLQLIVALATLQLLVGAVVWLVERRANPEQFGGGTITTGPVAPTFNL